MDACPHCHRRLLSHISARCNWCGTEITDAAYLVQAEVEWATSRAEDALHSLQSLTISQTTYRSTQIGYAAGNFSAPLMSPYDTAALVSKRAEYEAWEQARRAAVFHAQQQRASEETPAEEPAAEAQDRFGHLEL